MEDRNVTFNQIKGSLVKCPLLRIPNSLSNQILLSYFYLPEPDTLYQFLMADPVTGIPSLNTQSCIMGLLWAFFFMFLGSNFFSNFQINFLNFVWNKTAFLGLHRFSSLNVLHKGFLLQDWVFRLGWNLIQRC